METNFKEVFSSVLSGIVAAVIVLGIVFFPFYYAKKRAERSVNAIEGHLDSLDNVLYDMCVSDTIMLEKYNGNASAIDSIINTQEVMSFRIENLEKDVRRIDLDLGAFD